MSEDLERRVILLEGEVRELQCTMRTFYAEMVKTTANFQRTIEAAVDFRERTLAVLEKMAVNPRIQ